jgi:hypothetical protein
MIVHTYNTPFFSLINQKVSRFALGKIYEQFSLKILKKLTTVYARTKYFTWSPVLQAFLEKETSGTKGTFRYYAFIMYYIIDSPVLILGILVAKGEIVWSLRIFSLALEVWISSLLSIQR